MISWTTFKYFCPPFPCLLWACRPWDPLLESWSLRTGPVGRWQPLRSCSQTPGCSPSGAGWTSPCPRHTPGGLGKPDSSRGTKAAAAANCPESHTTFLFWVYWDVLSLLFLSHLRYDLIIWITLHYGYILKGYSNKIHYRSKVRGHLEEEKNCRYLSKKTLFLSIKITLNES